MRQVLLRAMGLLRRPWPASSLLLVALGGCALVFLPLFGVPGYELSLAVSLGIGVLGGIVGASAAGQERRLLEGKAPHLATATRAAGPTRAVVWASAAAWLAISAATAVPLSASLLYALLSSRCDPLAAIAFYPVLTLPSGALAALVGSFFGFAASRARWAALGYLLSLLGSLAVTAGPFLLGPQAYAFNHFLGYWPGPLYDEALKVGAPLGWFRVQTLLVAVAVGALSAWWLDPLTGHLSRPRLRPGPMALLGLCLAAAILLEVRAPSLGTRISEAVLTQRLGGVRESEHFTLVHWRGKPRLEVDRFVRDLELRHAQVKSFLGGAPPEKIRVYLYRSAEEKQSLVGAAQTQFAKPWLLELHVNEAGFPHPVLKHELVHVMAAPFGSGPFRVSARFGIWPVAGIIEGLAVAGDNPVDELTLHEWSAGMRRGKLMPDVRSLLSAEGFYGAAPSRAYTAAGSFLRYLGETHGSKKLTALYARGDFQAAYGRSLDELATEWERFLDALPLDAAAVNQAFSRFRRGSVFSRACAREVASLSAEAGELLASDPERALSIYRRCAEIQPDEPSFVLAQSAALVEAGRSEEAAGVLAELAARLDEQPSIRAEVAMAQADLGFRRGLPGQTRAHLEQVLRLDPSPSVDRTARVKLIALDAAESGAAIWAYFRSGAEDVKLLVLREALARDPENPVLSYLLGRRLAQSGAPGLAVPYLTTAVGRELPESVRKEAYRLLVEAQYLAGDCAGVRTTLGQLPSFGSAFNSRAESFAERCDFEDRSFNGPLVPEGPFR